LAFFLLAFSIYFAFLLDVDLSTSFLIDFLITVTALIFGG